MVAHERRGHGCESRDRAGASEMLAMKREMDDHGIAQRARTMEVNGHSLGGGCCREGGNAVEMGLAAALANASANAAPRGAYLGTARGKGFWRRAPGARRGGLPRTLAVGVLNLVG